MCINQQCWSLFRCFCYIVPIVSYLPMVTNFCDYNIKISKLSNAQESDITRSITFDMFCVILLHYYYYYCCYVTHEHEVYRDTTSNKFSGLISRKIIYNAYPGNFVYTVSVLTSWTLLLISRCVYILSYMTYNVWNTTSNSNLLITVTNLAI